MTTLLVAYGLGAAGPVEIAEAAAGLADLVFVGYRSDPHTAEMWELLGELGPCHDLAETDPRQLQGAADGIVTFSELMLAPAARLAARVGLRFHSEPVAAALTDKGRQRELLRDTRYVRVRRAEHLPAALAAVGVPAVIKPAVGYSSRDAFRCDTVDDGRAAVEMICADPHPRSDWIVEQLLPDGEHPDGPWLADYCSVETAVSAGRCYHFAVSDKLPLAAPLRERGSLLPSALPPLLYEQVCAAAGQAIAALGVDTGVLHTEVKLTPAGPRVIEVNGRLGGSVARLARSAGSLAPLRLAMRLALSGELPADRPARFDRIAFHYGVLPPAGPATVASLAPRTHFAGRPGVRSVERHARTGQVLDWRRGSGERVFTIWADVPDRASARALVAELDALAATSVVFEPVAAACER